MRVPSDNHEESGESVYREVKSRGGYWSLFSVLIIIVLLAALGLSLSRPQLNLENDVPLLRLVKVSGEIRSTGANTFPTQISFNGCAIHIGCLVTSVATNAPTFWIRSTSGSPGLMLGPVPFETLLVNGTSYDVWIDYVGAFGWQGGRVHIGMLLVSDRQSTGVMSKNFTIATPDSWVAVSGSISITGNQTVANPRPQSITWLSRTLGGTRGSQVPNTRVVPGGGFTAKVTANRFQISIPNNETYDLAISWVADSGSYGSCYIGPGPRGLGLIPVTVSGDNGSASYTYDPSCNVSNYFTPTALSTH